MAIRIDEINVQNLGPIRSLQLGLRDINLVYGKNERGKTFLVDFLLRSLFKSAPKSRRLMEANGLVKVSGLDEAEQIFSPSSRNKLEDYLADSMGFLPPNLYKLLVVRGGELAIVEGDPCGVSKQTLKEYLSNQQLLDAIEKPIPETIKSSTLQSGEIIGPAKGEVKRQADIESNIRYLDSVFGQVNDNLSTGARHQIDERLQNQISEAEELYRAKCYRAFEIDNQLKAVKAERQKIPAENLEDLNNLIRDYRKVESNIASRRKLVEEKSINYENYLWLVQATSSYQSLKQVEIKKPAWIIVVFSVLSLILSAVFAFLNLPLVSVLSVLLGLALGGIFISNMYQSTKNVRESDELRKIGEEYSKRFSGGAVTLASLQATLKKIEPDYDEYKRHSEELKEESKILENTAAEIKAGFLALTGETVLQKDWQQKYQEIRDKATLLNEKVVELDKDLLALGIPEEDFIKEKPQKKYDRRREAELSAAIEQSDRELAEEDRKLADLRAELKKYTEVDSNGWNELILGLENKRSSLVDDLTRIRARILGQNVVYQVISDLRLQEDDAIRRNLDTEKIAVPLKRITHRYERIEIDTNNRILVSDIYNQFDMADLSTGAQEQVLLALRIGFASILLGKEQPFLILDDAFQHSDWTRREYLLETTMDLAKEGCQILYLSMDDHIRELFQTKVKSRFKENYGYYELEN
jgi:uncharacterized protein YhaN